MKKPEPTGGGDAGVPFERLLETVEARLKSLEGGELSLDESLKAYEEGVRALRGCYGHLKAAEGRIEVLTGTGQEPEVADFDPESGRAAGKPRKAGARRRKTPDEGGEDESVSGDSGLF
jgi:exodeoxyribonuclease VII small subunit